MKKSNEALGWLYGHRARKGPYPFFARFIDRLTAVDWRDPMKRLVSFLVFGFISVAASAHSLDGLGYGEGYQPELGGEAQWLAHYRSDGTFRGEFRVYSRCQLQSAQVEEGNWSISNNRIHIVTSTIDGQRVDTSREYFRDDYMVDSLTEAELRITHIKSGRKFVTRRVDPRFVIPSCVIGRRSADKAMMS